MSLWDGKFQKELNGSGLFLRWPELLRTYSGQWAAAYRERFMALFEQLTGARVYHIYTIPGGVRGDIPRDKWLRELKDTVEYVKSELPHPNGWGFVRVHRDYPHSHRPVHAATTPYPPGIGGYFTPTLTGRPALQLL